MRYFSQIIFVVVVVLLCVAFTEGVIHAQTTLSGSATGLTGGKSEHVSFCDYWPLALGNSWDFVPDPDGGLNMEATDQFEVNGFEVWELTIVRGTFTGPETVIEYWVFADEWLYSTETPGDLDLLPEITGGLQATFPQWFTLGEPIMLPFYGMTVTPVLGSLSSFLPTFAGLTLEDFPLGEHFDALALCLGSGDPYILLGRDVGPLLFTYLIILESVDIIGACGGTPPVITMQPLGALLEVGQSHTFTVEVSAKAGFEYWWRKDGVSVDPAFNSPYLTIDAVSEEHAGWYACLVAGDGRTTMSKAAQLQVVPEGSLPGSGPLGLIILAGIIIAAGRRFLRSATAHATT